MVKSLLDLPNVGPATAADLHLLGINRPEDLSEMDAYEMYNRLCKLTNVRHDPCVIDVFLSVVSFVKGGPAKPWWDFTAERKKAAQSGNAVRSTKLKR